MNRVPSWVMAWGVAAILSATGAGGQAAVGDEVYHRWTFDGNGQAQGWSISGKLQAKVIGGSFWVRLGPDPEKVTQVPFPHEGAFAEQMFAPPAAGSMLSPSGLAIDATKAAKVRMRILNHSPETDGILWWRTPDQPGQDAGGIRFTMKPHASEWQYAVAHVDGAWRGTVDQLRIQPFVFGISGDVYIDEITVTDGAPRAFPKVTPLDDPHHMPQLELPGVTPEDWHDAFRVLQECLYVTVPVMGFPTPVLGPGGQYGENWWQLDSSLNLEGAKWVNQPFAENGIRGFAGVQDQNPDGRIDLWGGSPYRGRPGDVSSIPRYFEAAHAVAQRSSDEALRVTAYESMRDYLDWWLSPVKRKQPTGLISATSEETFAEPVLNPPGVMAAVDTNVAVALGCRNVSALARDLGRHADAEKYEAEFDALAKAINTYLWHEEGGYYCNYNLHQAAPSPRLLASAFDPMRLGIVPPGRQERLLKILTDPRYFNWGGLAITSIAKTEPEFQEAVGPYDGTA